MNSSFYTTKEVADKETKEALNILYIIPKYKSK